MSEKESYIIIGTLIAIVIIILIGTTIFGINIFPSRDGLHVKPSPALTPVENETSLEQKVEQYIRTHISELSPGKAVLGGTFYVTKIQFTDSHSGLVEYEDGHNALKAYFEYIVDNSSVKITTFTLR